MPQARLDGVPAVSTAQVLIEFRDVIIENWRERLAERWSGEMLPKLASHDAAIAAGTDAFQFLIELLAPGGGPDAGAITLATIERVHSEEFSIGDLYHEIKCLYEAIDASLPASTEELPELESIGAFRRESLDRFFAEVAVETSVVYEHFAERGNQPFLILDESRTISYANKSARDLLGEGSATGTPFTECLAPDEHERFEDLLEKLQAAGEPSPDCSSFRLLGKEGKSGDVDIELTRLEHATARASFYVSMSTAAQALGVGAEALERFDQGVLRIDASRRLVYANAAARKLLGPRDKPITSIHVDELFKGKDRETLEAELQKRERGELSRYEIELTRTSGGNIPVSVYAIPELDPAGRHRGSVAILSNLLGERATAELADCMLDTRSWEDNLKQLLRILFHYVHADVIAVTRYTADLSQAAVVASLDARGEPYLLNRKWFPLGEALRNWISQPGIKRYPDYPEFVRSDKMKGLADEPDIKGALENGIRSFMATPIMGDGAIRVGLSFAGKEYDQFTAEDEELVARLAIGEVILTAIQRMDREEKAFQFKLMSRLSRCRNFREIAHRVTKELARHYRWDNVSLFDVAVDLDRLELLKQHAGSELNYLLDDAHTQPSHVGLLGKAVREQQPIYARDVTEFDEFVAGHPKIKSEFIIPIFSRMYQPKRVFWLLNIEDSHTDFLNEEERTELIAIAEHIEFVVNRMMDRVTYEHAVRETTDGMIVTDANGDIRMVNPAALELLDHSSQESLLDHNIVDLFVERRFGEQFVHENFRDNHKVELRRADGDGEVAVLLSKLELPREISDKYFVFKSLETQQHLANLDVIDELVGYVANQIKTPLSLMQGMLNRLRPRTGAGAAIDLDQYAERARALLKQIELTYDRLAYSDPLVTAAPQNRSYVHVDRLLGWIERELGCGDENVIELRMDGEPRPVYGDRHQLRFVCDSLVSFLLRNLPADERILAEIEEKGDRLRVTLSADFPASAAQLPDTEIADIDRVKAEIGYGASAIAKIIESHGGRFIAPAPNPDEGRLQFEFELPVADSSED